MSLFYFLSYARHDDDDNRGRPVKRFFEDLESEIALLRGIGGEQAGFIDVDVPPAEIWRERLRQGLAQAEVFIALVSPSYLRSHACGREWALFERRMARAHASGRILPVLWINPARGELPSFISNINNRFDAETSDEDRLEALTHYRKDGLRHLALRRQVPNFRSKYDTVIAEIAKRIVHLATRPLPPLAGDDYSDFERIRPRFPQDEGASPSEPWPERHGSGPQPSVDLDALAARTAASIREDEDALATISQVTKLSRRLVGARVADASPRTRVRTLFTDAWPDGAPERATSARDLADRTAASVRPDRESVEAIASLLGVRSNWVQRTLDAANGRSLVRNVFADRWPPAQEHHEPDVTRGQRTPSSKRNRERRTLDLLGELTAATAREDQDSIEEIGKLLGIAPRWVRRHLNAANGRMLVRNVFEQRWPEANEEQKLVVAEDREPTNRDDLGDFTAAVARGDQAIVDDLGAMLEMEPRWIRRLLNAANGRTLVRNVFDYRWPPSVDEAKPDPEAAGDLRVSAVREDRDMVEAIAAYTELSERGVVRLLNAAAGHAVVRNALGAHWPIDSEEDDGDDIGDRSAASARDDEELIAAVAKHTGLSPFQVGKRLRAAHGRTRVRNVFSRWWERRTDAEEVSTDSLGDQTAAAALRDPGLVEAIGETISMTERWVRRYLNAVNGRTLIRNVFAQHWPDELPAEAMKLGDRTCVQVRDDEVLIEAIADFIGASTWWVRRAVTDVDGRTLVRNACGHRWPSD